MALHVYATRSDQAGDGEAPAPVDESGVVLNHAILMAEILGVDATEPLELINAVHAQGVEGLPEIYVRDEQEVMAGFLESLLAALDTAADDEGRATDSPGGHALAASAYLSADGGGRLMILNHAMLVTDLRRALAGVLENFRYALAHEMLVRTD